MSQTPPPTDSMSVTPPTAAAAANDEPAKRNVACVNCRNSKVRCKPSLAPGMPCQRCDKLSAPCVVDKFHKRVTKRSKLELLEQELQSIKRAVAIPAAPTSSTTTTAKTDTPWTPVNQQQHQVSLTKPSQQEKQPVASTWTPPSPRTQHASSFSSGGGGVAAQLLPGASLGATPLSDRTTSSGHGGSIVAELQRRAEPTQPRMLGEHIVSGEDVDWYFTKFLQCFHPFLPLLRKRNPDDCYEASPVLFWVVIYITCRRYTKDRVFFHRLAEYVSREIWTLLPKPVMQLEDIHAMLFLACWPLPTIRLVTDPSTTLVSIAMTNAMMMGLHTSRGSNREFCIGLRKTCECTDAEAASTWIGCCVLAERVAACSGYPPPSIRLDDEPCKEKLTARFWTDLLLMFRMQKFMNRFHTAMAAHVSSCGGVSHMIVSMWESELEIVKPVIAPKQSDLEVFLCVSALLEMQVFYFNPDNAIDNPPAPANITKAFHTARALVTIALDQEARNKFLTHAAHWVFRLMVDAACVIVAVLHSPTAPEAVPPAEAAGIAQQAIAAVHRCSVQDNDLPHRAGVIIETFWRYRYDLPLLELGECTWSSRLSVGFTFWCLDKFKVGLQVAQQATDAAAQVPDRGANAMQYEQAPVTTYAAPETTTTATTTDPPNASSLLLGNDNLMEIDWNMFMEEFGWVNEHGVLLGLP